MKHTKVANSLIQKYLKIFQKVPRDLGKSSERFRKKFREIFPKVPVDFFKSRGGIYDDSLNAFLKID